MSDPNPVEPEVVAEPVPPMAVARREQGGAVGILRPADTLDAIADAFKQYQAVCERILTADDYQEYEGKPRKKKSAWRKLATAFNVSTEVVEKEIQRDQSGNVVSAFFTVNARAGNRCTNGSGYCEITERCCPTRQGQKCHKAAWKGHYCCPNGCDGRKHWSHANHDVIATAETRAKNRAIADLIGCGEVSAEELTDENAPQTRQAPKPAKQPAPTTKAAPTPQSAPNQAIVTPTAAYRSVMIKRLRAQPGEPNRPIVTEFFRKLTDPTPLMPNEELESLDLRFVPANDQQMKDLGEMVTRFGNGDRAEWPYRPHNMPLAKAVEKAVEQATDKAKDPLWWRGVIVTVPRKGMKKADYDKKPDTIGSLFDLRHGNDDEAQSARQRLFGLVHNWEPAPREFRGQTYNPTEADLKCRDALTAFLRWFEANHPDEKL